MIVTDLDRLSDPVIHDPSVDHEYTLERLKEALEDVEGYGLAANQIGIRDSRSCIINVKEEIELVNPEIVNREGTTRTWESCLSIPGEQVRTQRSVWVTVEADNWMGQLEFGPGSWTEQDENNRDKKREPAYLESIVVQHECLPSRSLVTTRNGYKTIGKIVRDELSIEVLSLNEDTGQTEFKEVIGWKKSNNGPKGNRLKSWVKLKYNESGYAPLKTLVCTSDHPVAVIEDPFRPSVEYVNAGRSEGKWVVREPTDTNSNNEHVLFNSDQLSVALGTILGDGHINSGILYMNHGQAQKDYVEWKSDILGGRIERVDGIGYDPEVPNWCGVVNSNAQIVELENLLYSDDHKTLELLPLTRLLSPLALAVWYQDDGCIVHNGENGKKTAQIHTESFSFSDVEKVSQVLLDKYNIKTGVHTRELSNGSISPLLYFHTDTIHRFWKLISPYIHESMAYKLSPSYRDVEPCPIDSEPLSYAARLVHSVQHKSVESHLYDIEVEGNNNFFAQNCLVHNCDHLNGKTILDREIEREPYQKSELEKLGRNDKVEVENADGEIFEVKWKHAKKHDDWNVLSII